jgi:Icc-related predicted phosphoesterase
MKIQAISDTHGSDFFHLIGDSDILLIAGDISPARESHDYYPQKRWFHEIFVKQLSRLTEKVGHVVFIGGNHDTYLSDCNISANNSEIRSALPKNVHYLCDDLVDINGLRIFGSPWCNAPTWARIGPPVWNFAGKDETLQEVYAKIPHDIDILISHGPAHGFCDVILDPALNGRNLEKFGAGAERLGSKALTASFVRGLSPKYVISGHIHSANHNFEVYKSKIDGTAIKFACVSILDEQYTFNPAYRPLIINIDNEQEKNNVEDGSKPENS